MTLGAFNLKGYWEEEMKQDQDHSRWGEVISPPPPSSHNSIRNPTAMLLFALVLMEVFLVMQIATLGGAVAGIIARSRKELTPSAYGPDSALTPGAATILHTHA